jgi:O-antigen/teichoic acid export membrane protein
VLKKRLALNLGANLMGQITTVISQLGMVPLFLSCWDKEHYGVWLMISSIPAYLSLGEAGFATVSANEMSMAVSAGDYAKARRSLHTAWGFLLVISIVLGVLVAAALGIIGWQHWLPFPGISTGSLCWVLGLLSVYSIAGIINAVFIGIYRAGYKNARNIAFNTGGRLAELGAMVVCVVASHSLIVISAAMLGVRLATSLAMYLDSRRLLPQLQLGLEAFCWNELRRTWRPAAMFMAATLGNAFYFQGLTLVVGVFLGPTAVVVYNTTRTLTRAIVQFVTMIKHSVWPEFSYLFGAGDLVRARRLNELAFEISWCASLIFAVMIFVAAPYVVPLWTRHAVVLDPKLLAIFLCSAVLNGIWFVTSGLLMGINQHSGLTLRYLFASSVALMLAVPGVYFFGLYGAAIVMVIGELLLLPYAIARTCQLLQQSVYEFLEHAVLLTRSREAITQFWQRHFLKAGQSKV